MEKQEILDFIEKRLKYINDRGRYMIGYPEYIGGYYDADFPEMFKQFIINCGNPFTEADNYSIQAKDFEREVLYHFMDLYKMDRDTTYGYICNGSTEGSLYALYRARDTLKNPVLLFSDSSHYSLEKIAKVLRIPYIIIPSDDTGSISIKDLQETVGATEKESIIVSANIGTILKGAIDDVPQIHELLTESGKQFHIHLDAALFGGYLPFIEEEYCRSLMSFAGSLALSIQKFFGVPMSAGLVLVKNISHIQVNIDTNVDYINSFDSTISGSRNGAATVMSYYIVKTKEKDVFAKDAREMIQRANFLQNELNKRSLNAGLLPKSNTVYFDKPKKDIVNKWQLSWHGDTAHVVVMPHVTEEVIKEFLADIDA